MSRTVRHLERIFKFFASIQLAVIIIISLAIISAVGTIVEARYDASYAQKLVYGSPYMYFIMGLLCVNLVNVMIDRWPWKPYHAGFVLAHIGIIILIVGSLITKFYGVDGSISIDVGKNNRYVMLPDTEFIVYGSFGEGNYKHLHSIRQDFLVVPPQKVTPEVELSGQKLRITDYYHYAIREQKIIESDSEKDGPALRIQLQNKNVNVTQWIEKNPDTPFSSFNLGPAKVVLAADKTKYSYEGGNEVVLSPNSDGRVRYQIYTKSKGGITSSGVINIADVIDTGWMGLELRLLKYLPRAKQEITYIKKARPTGMTSSAIKIEFDGKTHWIGLNSNLRLFTDSSMYLVSYRNHLLDLGFDMGLEKFTVGRYQGTNRAMSYESVVNVPGLGSRLISMNEPLKYSGYTFYQASFQENETGEATTSILSVNKDPGRFIKYLGSFLIVLGTILMFYFKHYRLKIFGQAT